MAQTEHDEWSDHDERGDHDEWNVGQKCEIFDESKQEWIIGEILEITIGKHLKVGFGDSQKIVPEDSEDVRVSSASKNDEKMTKNMIIQKTAARLAIDLSVSQQKAYEVLKDLYDNSREDGMDCALCCYPNSIFSRFVYFVLRTCDLEAHRGGGEP